MGRRSPPEQQEELTPEAKRRTLEAKLHAYDQHLEGLYGASLVNSGKCLLLGRHYANSPYIYFSLNPGYARDGSALDLSSEAQFNVPFKSSDALRRQYVYLQNCARFFSDHPDLGTWMNAGVTSAFLVPWRTRNVSELYALNRQSGGAMFEAARDLVRLIIHHHNACLLFAAGKSAIQLLNDLCVPDSSIQIERFLGSGGSYQWSRSEMTVNGKELTILQVPHFSRANSPAKMSTFGEWLRAQLAPLAPQLTEPKKATINKVKLILSL